MKVLLVAPDNPDLKSISATVAAISRYLDVTPLVGTVREVDIQREVGNGPYAILWFVTHGSSTGLALTGSILPPEAVGQYTEQAEAQLCVMSTCDSEDIANRIVAGGPADMVCTITSEVGDADAARFDALFAKELAGLPESEKPDFESAFDRARGPGATKYRYIRARAALRGLAVQAATITERLQEKVETLTLTQYKQGLDLQSLTDRFAQMTQQALLSQQQAMQTQASTGQMAAMERSLTTHPPPGAFTAPLVLLIILATLLLLTAVFFLGRTF